MERKSSIFDKQITLGIRMGPIVILSLIWLGLEVTAMSTITGHRFTGGAKGKSASSDPDAVETFGAPRIYGGNETIPHEFPSMLLLFANGRQACGGVLLDAEWALTAGHCAHRFNGEFSDFKFFAGKHYLALNESTEQTVQAIECFTHENLGGQNNSRVYDIALFKVDPPFKFNEYVQKLVLPKRDGVYSTGFATVVGWGQNGTSTVPDKLQKASVPLMTNERCQEIFDHADKEFGIFPVHICAGGVNGTGVCKGDSGGPMYVEEDGRQVLVGLTSWGVACAEEFPAVFTRVSEFLDWIENTTRLAVSGGAERLMSEEGSSGKSDTNNVAVRAKISNGLAQSLCKGFAEYQKDKALLPAGALKIKPKTPEKCALFIWSKCKSDESCKPIGLKTCAA